MTDNFEQEIISKGLTAPRITSADIEANVASEHYFTADQGEFGAAHDKACYGTEGPALNSRPPEALRLLTFCVLVMRNGFTVTGESACASPQNFDAEIGRKIARQNAVAKVWPLMGYALKERLAIEAAAKPSADADRNLLRHALAGLVGASSSTELRDMEVFIRGMPVPNDDKGAMLKAIHALMVIPEAGGPADAAHG